MPTEPTKKMTKSLKRIILLTDYEDCILNNLSFNITPKSSIKSLKIKDKEIEDYLYNEFKNYIK